jgi:hypothetical protein
VVEGDGMRGRKARPSVVGEEPPVLGRQSRLSTAPILLEAVVQGGLTGPPLAYNHFVLNGAPMSRTLILITGVVILLSATQGASAFSTRQVDPVITSDRPADPHELADKTSNGQSGERTFGLPGGQLRLQFSAPPSGGTANGPFLASPGTAFVPSEHR